MNVLVMDVEGTDGRERGEDQVRIRGPRSLFLEIIFTIGGRTSSESRPFSPLPPRRYSLSTCGNTKLACIRERTWGYSRLCLR